MNIVFVVGKLQWPPRVGPTVHAGNLMRSLAMLGEKVFLVTEEPVAPEALAWLKGVECRVVDTNSDSQIEMRDEHRSTWIDKRISRYLGGGSLRTHLMQHKVQTLNADAVVGIGFDALPFFLGPGFRVPSVWYIADDPLLHHYELFRLRHFGSFVRIAVLMRVAGAKFKSVWVVSKRDALWSKRVSGLRRVLVIPNGVDRQMFHSEPSASQRPHACCFWGNLSFPPNLSAITYWLDEIWPAVRSRVPDAEFHVAGVKASESLIQKMASTPGVVFHGEVRDLNEAFCGIGISVFPFLEGAGVKNKVLEAAAMAKAVVISPKASNGLFGEWRKSLLIAKNTRQWVDELVSLMMDESEQKKCGDLARQWVTEAHCWENSARLAVDNLISIRLD